jgi:ankyrin repeat protein
MSKLAAAKLELAKKDRKEANDLLYKVIVGDEPRVKQLLGVGVNPDAFIDSANPCRGGKGLSDGMSALSIAIVKGYIRIARYLLKAGASTDRKSVV